jgi:predicted 2-oxoglutarate/Fe(II)-dependent dioxygenase YbiX
MGKRVEDYVMRIPTLDKNICKKIVNTINKYDWYKHEFVTKDGKVNEEYQASPCETLENTSQDHIIIDSLYDSISKYVNEIGGEYYKGWKGYSPIKYNKYEVGNLMEKHADHIHSVFRNDYGVPTGIPVLSCIGVLNDDYEGGEIEMFEDTKIDLKPGEVLIFPSVFLYPHKVCEITKGTRYSFVSWVY